jgi:archaellum component FlaG (FlaF/FlaG flagellin family)
MIFFITALILATSVAGVMVVGVGSIADSFNQKGKIMAAQLETEIKIINDPYNTEETFYVKNTGKTIMNPNEVSVIVDGEYEKAKRIEIMGKDDDAFRPGDVMEIKVNYRTNRGEHTVKIIMDNGASDTLRYVIR